jgi:hypothetical protein
MNVIAFSGKAGSGKSTSASYLVDHYGYTLLKFADPMKDMLRALGLGSFELEGSGKEMPCFLLGGKTPRFAMQTLGTEWGRDTLSYDIWVTAWLHRAESLIKSGKKVVCDDVRFPNEVEAVKKLSGVLIHIKDPTRVDHSDSHISESGGLQHDFRILNNGTITELYEKVDQYFRNRI